MNTTTPSGEPPREPSPEEIARGLAQLEALVQPEPATEPAPVEDDEPLNDPDDQDDDEEFSTALVPLAGGETKRVQKLRREVAEAHLLADLQDDEIPLSLDTTRVRKLRRRTWEAARLHELSQHPAAIAYRDAKVRRVTTIMVMTAAGIALAVSSIGVQSSVVKALELTRGDLGWWASYGVEAVLSLPLLAAVGVQAYSAIRGRVVDRKSPEGRRLFRTELALLGLTLTLNCWPAFAAGGNFGDRVLRLIVHSLGPVAAVLAVWVLPTLWKVLADLPVPVIIRPTAQGGTRTSTRRNGLAESPLESPPSPPRPAPGSDEDIAQKVDQIRHLIEAGQLSRGVGVKRIRDELQCATATARTVRNRLVEAGDLTSNPEGGSR